MRIVSRREVLPLLAGLVSGCATTGGAKPSPVAEGYYFLHSDAFYKNGLTRVRADGRGGAEVVFLDHFGGGFVLDPRGPGSFRITRDRIAMGEVGRSLSGSGRVTPGGGVEGECTVWLTGLIGLSRDHRTGTWTLRPASADEADRALSKLRRRYPGRLESMGL